MERETRVTGVSSVQTDKGYDFEKCKIGGGGGHKGQSNSAWGSQRRLQRGSDVSKTSKEE